MLKVVCWKWDNGMHPKKGLKFTAQHVNRLRNMVKRHLKIPHQFICITDDPRGIDPDIRVIKLWNSYRDMGGCYVRLRAFAKEMKTVIGSRFLWLDLDCVILDDITDLVNRGEDFMMWGDTHPTTPYNGSMVLMNAGCRSQVWEDFDRKESPLIGRRKGYVGTDQAWIASCLGPREAKWGVDDGVYSFRCHISKMDTLPENAKIVFFHGASDPSQSDLYEKYPWIKGAWQ